MKNRRLNVLFVAIIALAAAPQALDDARHLMNSAQETIEAGFWNTFLSYRARGVEVAPANRRPELIAAVRPLESEDCSLEREASMSGEVVKNSSRAIENPALTRKSREANPARDDKQQVINVEVENFEFNFKPGDESEALLPTRQEKKAFRTAGLHALDAARISDAVAKATLASSLFQKEEQMRMRKVLGTDKQLRPKARYLLDRGEVKTEAPALPRAEGI